MSRTPLNPFAISHTLGGVMIPGAKARFGNLPLLQATASMLGGRPEILPEIAFTDSDDQVIAKVFERLREGLAVDRFLADPASARKFAQLCRRLGVRQSPAAINRRLLRLRKATGGGRLLSTTRRDSRPGLVERFGPAVEFAMVKMAVRFGASVDDLLADPDLGVLFEGLARSVIPGGDPIDYRLCALQIRKNRHLERSDRSLFERLESAEIEPQFEELGSLAHVRIERAPEEEGLILLQEPARPLFLSRFHDLRTGAQLLAKAKIAEGMSIDNQFWKADPAGVWLRYISSDDLPDASARLWELRLIRDLQPAYNWPVRAA